MTGKVREKRYVSQENEGGKNEGEQIWRKKESRRVALSDKK